MQGFAWTEGDGTRSDASEKIMAEGIADRLGAIASSGTKVAMIADTPQTPGAVYECVAEKPDDVAACGFDLASGSDKSALPTQRAAVAAMSGTVVGASVEAATPAGTASPVTLLDLTDAICPPQTASDCPPIIGNAMVYRQGSHLTATYVSTLSDRLGQMMVSASLLPAG